MTGRLLANKFIYNMYENDESIDFIYKLRVAMVMICIVRLAVRETSMHAAFFIDVIQNFLYLLISFYSFVIMQLPK